MTTPSDDTEDVDRDDLEDDTASRANRFTWGPGDVEVVSAPGSAGTEDTGETNTDDDGGDTRRRRADELRRRVTGRE